MLDEPSKRVLVVTRRLPPSVESRIARDYRPRFNASRLRLGRTSRVRWASFHTLNGASFS